MCNAKAISRYKNVNKCIRYCCPIYYKFTSCEYHIVVFKYTFNAWNSKSTHCLKFGNQGMYIRYSFITESVSVTGLWFYQVKYTKNKRDNNPALFPYAIIAWAINKFKLIQFCTHLEHWYFLYNSFKHSLLFTFEVFCRVYPVVINIDSSKNKLLINTLHLKKQTTLRLGYLSVIFIHHLRAEYLSS